ncbi:Phosphoglycolate phosphatase [Frankliniella fusca]|uniref:Phosphoglycolate phosphatase n=1 Tax=Frankliniella fusca TaxID=407009 RepID=A0AAE1LTF1_9NEOP|nr:Phosphoglycolate phosphatase [Frankliniella fusca]
MNNGNSHEAESTQFKVGDPPAAGQQGDLSVKSTAQQSSLFKLSQENVTKHQFADQSNKFNKVENWLATAVFPSSPQSPARLSSKQEICSPLAETIEECDPVTTPAANKFVEAQSPSKPPSEQEVFIAVGGSTEELEHINTGVADKFVDAESIPRGSEWENKPLPRVSSDKINSSKAPPDIETTPIPFTPEQSGNEQAKPSDTENIKEHSISPANEVKESSLKRCSAPVELELNGPKKFRASPDQYPVDINSNIVSLPLISTVKENVVENLTQHHDQPTNSAKELNPTVIVINADNCFKESSLQDLSSLFNDNIENEITVESIDISVEAQHDAETPSVIIPLEGNTTEAFQEETELDISVAENATPPASRKQSTRKRSCTPAEWKHNKAKKALNSGEAHFNVKGQFRPGKVMRPACVCKAKCSLRVNEEQRLAIHNLFWKTLADKRRQWEYIYNHTPTEAKKKSTTSGPSRRANSRKYYLGILSENLTEVKREQVCKKMFTNTLVIGDGVIVTAHNHCKKGSSTPDKRGKYHNRPNKATEVQKSNIRAHINSFPRIPSHYVRAKCQREYLECGLSISKMAAEYKKWCDLNKISIKDRGSKHMYRKVLNAEFNIGFFVPKKDQCQLCNMFKSSTRQERESGDLKDKWIAHVKSKNNAYEMQKKARTLLTTRTDVAMCTFDLQKVLPCPRSETSVFFYRNKLSVFNLTVYDVRTHLGKCYVWHEGIAKRGANDIGSCVFKHISSYADNGIKELHSFSDSCSGQNRNRFIYAMLLLAATMFSIKIRHCFLEPGHTYNEGDSVHASIEKAAKRKEVFDLSEWVELIKTSKVTEPHYQVALLKRSDFMDFHDLVNKQNWEKDTQGSKITWNKVKIVEAGFHGDGIISVQYTYDGPKHFLNTNQRRGHPVNLKTYKPPCAYPDKIPLQAMTVKHLQELCASKAIPSKYHQFYGQVIAGVEPVEEGFVGDQQAENDSYDPEDVVDDAGCMEGGDEELGNFSETGEDVVVDDDDDDDDDDDVNESFD